MSSRTLRSIVLGMVTVLSASVFAPLAHAAAHRADDDVVFTIKSDVIVESSSLVVSSRYPHLVYTTNDSGDAPTVYVLDSRSGELVGTTTLSGVEAVDVEALAGSRRWLVVGDIGDNEGVRDDVTVYRIPQPGRGDATVEADAVALTYEDRPRDAEGVLYDGGSGRVFVVSKEYAEAHVYRTSRDVFDHSRSVLKPIAEAPDIATDATFLPGDETVAIRTYFAVDFYRYPSWEHVTTNGLPLQRQGESIAAPRDGKQLWIGTEGTHSQVLSVPIPTAEIEPPPEPTPVEPSSTPTAHDEDREQQLNRAVVIGGSAAVLFVLVLIVGIVRYVRHHPDH